jgi:hypothetical protein
MHKPYQCTVADCGKRYKNLNGLKYHIEHAHSSLLGDDEKENEGTIKVEKKKERAVKDEEGDTRMDVD